MHRETWQRCERESVGLVGKTPARAFESCGAVIEVSLESPANLKSQRADLTLELGEVGGRSRVVGRSHCLWFGLVAEQRVTLTTTTTKTSTTALLPLDDDDDDNDLCVFFCVFYLLLTILFSLKQPCKSSLTEIELNKKTVYGSLNQF